MRARLATTSGGAEHRGGLVLALGLLEDRRASPLLRSIVEDRRAEGDLRGLAAEAVGLVGDPGQQEYLALRIEDPSCRAFRGSLVAAAGLLRAKGSTSGAVDLLESPDATIAERNAAAIALGRIRPGPGSAALDRLVGIAEDRFGKHDSATRAAATDALGRIGSNRWDRLADLSRGVNYRALTPALAEVLAVP